ncbi:MAG: Gfo/Idh/MocA family oxidoreductase [Cellvibrionaceae bacterium]
MSLRLGIIGLSEGNGHPYSWSAIFNGYNEELIEQCGYPVIPRYLKEQSWPSAKIHEASVTHVWSQDKTLSELIAKTCHITHVVDSFEDMIGSVDAVLLARDDAENHLAMTSPFLKAGLPVYIDKPICLSVSDLQKLYKLQLYEGQIFSCSALRYAKELHLSEFERAQLGTIQHVQCYTPKSWDKYAIHLLDPLLLLIGNQGELKSSQNWSSEGYSNTHYQWESGLTASVSSLGNVLSPIGFKVFGQKSSKELIFADTFSAFKQTLNAFVQGVINKEEVIPYSNNYRVVDMIEKGRG